MNKYKAFDGGFGRTDCLQRVGGLGTGLFMPEGGQQEQLQYLELDVTDHGIHLSGNPLPQPGSDSWRLVLYDFDMAAPLCPVMSTRRAGRASIDSNTAGVNQAAQRPRHSPLISFRSGPSRGQTPLRSDTHRLACTPAWWPRQGLERTSRKQCTLCMCDRWSGEHSAAKGLAAHRGTTWRELGPDAINAGQPRLSTVDLGRVRSRGQSRLGHLDTRCVDLVRQHVDRSG